MGWQENKAKMIRKNNNFLVMIIGIITSAFRPGFIQSLLINTI